MKSAYDVHVIRELLGEYSELDAWSKLVHSLGTSFEIVLVEQSVLALWKVLVTCSSLIFRMSTLRVMIIIDH